MVLVTRKSHNCHEKTKHLKLDHSDSTALETFVSTTSHNFHKLLSGHITITGSNHHPPSISLSWYIPCFNFIQGVNTAFSKLVKHLDYPLTKWSPILAEYHFAYTLNILDALNSITSSISQVGTCRLSLSHAINLMSSNTPSSAIPHLKPIVVTNSIALDFKQLSDVGSLNEDKERAIHEAMMKMRSVDLLVLKLLVCGLCGQMSEDMMNTVEFEGLKFEFGDQVKEIKEVNEVVKRIEGCLVDENKSKYAAEAEAEAEELRTKIVLLDSLTQMLTKQVDCFFSEVLATRNELIACFRLPKSSVHSL